METTMDLDHIYTEEVLDSPGFNSARDFYLDHIPGPFVLHAHLVGKACDGNCPTYHLPNEDDEEHARAVRAWRQSRPIISPRMTREVAEALLDAWEDRAPECSYDIPVTDKAWKCRCGEMRASMG